VHYISVNHLFPHRATAQCQRIICEIERLLTNRYCLPTRSAVSRLSANSFPPPHSPTLLSLVPPRFRMSLLPFYSLFLRLRSIKQVSRAVCSLLLLLFSHPAHNMVTVLSPGQMKPVIIWMGSIKGRIFDGSAALKRGCFVSKLDRPLVDLTSGANKIESKSSISLSKPVLGAALRHLKVEK